MPNVYAPRFLSNLRRFHNPIPGSGASSGGGLLKVCKGVQLYTIPELALLWGVSASFTATEPLALISKVLKGFLLERFFFYLGHVKSRAFRSVLNYI